MRRQERLLKLWLKPGRWEATIMKVNRKKLWVGGTTAFALTIVVFAAVGGERQGGASELGTPLSSPAGITLQPLNMAQGYGLDSITAAIIPWDNIVYADSNGMTLYTNDMNPPEHSTCVEECASIWLPTLASVSTEAFGEWSVIDRDDGTRQWALKGKPLYTYIKDVDVGSVGGNSPKRYGRGPNIGERGRALGPIADDVPMPAGWHAATFFPVSDRLLPPGLTINHVPDAAGLVLVNDVDQSLYVFLGSPNEDSSACDTLCDWTPVVASQLAAPIGDFIPIARNDGISQWTYKGLGLYTYAHDLLPGDANGDGVDSNWQVAHITRHYMPEGVTIQESLRLGKVLANAQGQTLYERDAYIFQSGSGHSLRRGIPIRPAVGRDLGTAALCRVECEKWHPFLAPAEANPQGYWDVYTRADGGRQWAYQGYALWTYDGDKEPGDINAQDDWDMTIFAAYEDSDTIVDIGTRYDGVATLYWTVAVP